MASSSTSASSSQTVVRDRLSTAISDAISRTGNELGNQFLPKEDLENILNLESLIDLYIELFSTSTARRESHVLRATRQSLGNEAERLSVERNFTEFANRTLRVPQRITLLALFLFDLREDCLALFKDWLSGGRDLPSDADLPLSQDGRELPGFRPNDVKYIWNHQAVFKPFTIAELEHQLLPPKYSKPFLGTPKEINRGASGTVYEIKIAAGYWKYKKFQRDTLTTDTVIVAMKIFQPEHAQDYETERDFLKELRDHGTNNTRILLDLGGPNTANEQGKLTHSLFFDLAKCNLDQFLKSDRYAEKYTSKSVLLLKAMEIVEALVFLNKTIKSLHLDIKPDNILVFEDIKNKDGMIWKLTDFNLAMKKITRSKIHGQLEASNVASTESTVPSVREPGLYQAPEIQTRELSPASEASDVWSMGVILLALFAFLHDGPQSVRNFEGATKVKFDNQGGERRSVYVTRNVPGNSSMFAFPEQGHRPLRFLDGFKPSIEIIESEIEATVHPDIMLWFEGVYDDASRSEKPYLKQALGIIFMEVLVIDRHKRLDAARLHTKFIKVQKAYKILEEPGDLRPDAGDPPTPNPLSTHSKPCAAISSKALTSIRELVQDPQAANEQCPICKTYPIHQALRNSAYDAIEALLKPPSTINVNIKCPSSYQKPMDIGCEGSGDTQALQLLLKYRKDDIEITEDSYKRPKGRLKSYAQDPIKRHMKYQRSREMDLSRQRSAGTQSVEGPVALSGKLVDTVFNPTCRNFPVGCR